MQRKAFVLLSGGLDSTTCLYKAIHDYAPNMEQFKGELKSTDVNVTWVEAVSIDYGQRHTKEIEYAQNTCKRLGIQHTILDVGKLLSGANVMLSQDSVGNVDVPDISYADIKGVSPTYVPFRNGLMLSALTAHAQKYVNKQIESSISDKDVEIRYRRQTDTLGSEAFNESYTFNQAKQDARDQATKQAKDLVGIYFGAHSEDAQNWAYPDCTPEFIGAMANAIYVGSYNTIRLHTPLEWLMKYEIVRMGSNLGVPFAYTWSCYKGEEKHCGTCPTCRSRKEAFEAAGISDPTEYAA